MNQLSYWDVFFLQKLTNEVNLMNKIAPFLTVNSPRCIYNVMCHIVIFF